MGFFGPGVVMRTPAFPPQLLCPFDFLVLFGFHLLPALKSGMSYNHGHLAVAPAGTEVTFLWRRLKLACARARNTCSCPRFTALGRLLPSLH